MVVVSIWGLVVLTSQLLPSVLAESRRVRPMSTTHSPHVVETAICMYMSGASGILLGRPIAPDRCIPQKTEVVPKRSTSSWILDTHSGSLCPTRSSCVAVSPTSRPKTAPSDST